MTDAKRIVYDPELGRRTRIERQVRELVATLTPEQKRDLQFGRAHIVTHDADPGRALLVYREQK
jgi:hypothetical protein